MAVNEMYKNLMDHWGKYKYEEYPGQDLNEAGKAECEELYINDPLDGEMKSRLSMELLQKILSSHNKEYIDKDVIEFLTEFPLAKYYFTFIDKLSVVVKENLMSKEMVYTLGLAYVTKSKETTGIKLGLTLLRFSDNEDALNILKAFSNHNDFIFYAVEGIKEYPMCNSIIFDISKASKGYGKIIAVTNLEPINDEIRKWIMEEGSNNEFLEPVLIALTFDEEYYYDYFLLGKRTKAKYALFTDKLRQLSQLNGFFEEHKSFEMIMVYWEYYKSLKKSFDNIYVMCALLGLFVGEEDEEVEEDKPLKYMGFSIDEKRMVSDIANEFLQEDLSSIIYEALKSDKYLVDDVIEVAMALKIKLLFADFKKVLKKDPMSLGVYNYMMLQNDDNEKEILIKFSEKIFDWDIIAKGPENITEDDLDYDYLNDSCLYLVIEYMDSLVNKNIDINIKALKARYLPTRKAAFNNLMKKEIVLKEEHIQAIKDLAANETDRSFKSTLLRFLKEYCDVEKKRQYENVSEVYVRPHAKDIFLTKTFIAGIKYIDLSVVECTIKESQLVFLKREKDNPYDENAIMVLTSSGYVIGYIPRAENEILKNLLDCGKIIYGKIESIKRDYSSIEINLYLSYVDIMKEVTSTFSMVTEQSLGYLN